MENKLEIREDIINSIKDIRVLEKKNIDILKTIAYSFGDVSCSLLSEYLENDKKIESLRDILFNKMTNLKLFKNREEFNEKIKKNKRLINETNILFDKILKKNENKPFLYLESKDTNLNNILEKEQDIPFVPKCLYCGCEINDGSQLCAKSFCYVEFDDAKKIKERIIKRKRDEKLGINKFILPKPKV